jgi:hypothetical protein
MAPALKLLPKKLVDTDSATVKPDAPNVLQAMMQLHQPKSRANKLALEEEKERDTAEK